MRHYLTTNKMLTVADIPLSYAATMLEAYRLYRDHLDARIESTRASLEIHGITASQHRAASEQLSRLTAAHDRTKTLIATVSSVTDQM